VGNKNVLNRWIRGGASALLALGLLAGCIDAEPEPTFTLPLPDSTPSPNEGQEPDADIDPVDELEPPEIPEFSDEAVEAAEQVVDYFIAAYEYGYSANDPEPLLAVSHPDCGTCSMHAENMLDRVSSGITSSGGQLDLIDAEVFLVEGDQILIEATIAQDALTRYDANSAIVEQKEPSNIDSMMVLYYRDGIWQIHAIHNESAEGLL